jgi:phenylacetate-CoA ligase
VHETYGSAEGLMMAAQKDLEQMYIMTPNVVVEILDDNGNEVKDGEMGHVVVTNLNAFAMPLIRYRIGDLAIKLPGENYPLKRELNLPILQKVIGRDTDLIKTQSGKYMVVHSFTGIFEHVPEIEQFCIIQNVLAGITIQYIPAVTFTVDCLVIIKEKILENLKENLEIKFQKVEQIQPSRSGKPQIIISNLK